MRFMGHAANMLTTRKFADGVPQHARCAASFVKLRHFYSAWKLRYGHNLKHSLPSVPKRHF